MYDFPRQLINFRHLRRHDVVIYVRVFFTLWWVTCRENYKEEERTDVPAKRLTSGQLVLSIVEQ